ncbi:MAG: RNA polymerase sigma factor [Acidobacteriota bacterium]
MTEEAGLVARAVRGDRAAFEALVVSRQKKVFWTAFQVVGNEEDARDISQQVFIRLWKALPRYQARWRFDTWLYRITVNLAIDAYRRQQVRPEVRNHGLQEPAPVRAKGEPEEAYRRAEVQRIFLRLARRLPAQQRAVFVLREMQDLDMEQIATIMAISPSTARNHLHQARKVLRRGLASLYPEYLPGTPGKSGARGDGR